MVFLLSGLSHILIIPDGNRRFADSHNITYDTIYKLVAVNTTLRLIEEILLERDIRELSIFMLSRNNVLKRSREDLQPIFSAQTEAYSKLLKNKKISDAKIKFNFVGDRLVLPKEYLKSMGKIESKTKNNQGKVCNFLVAYDGSWELLEAVKKMKANNENFNEFNLYKNLEIKNAIDLIIRSGGEKRLSGCPLIQASYAELYFGDFFYPQFTVDKLNEIIKSYNLRHRRFGK